MNKKKEITIKAFSLIEVLIFTTILSLFFVVAVSVLTVSIRASKLNEHKIYAKHYADELYEWLISEKEKNWGGNSTDQSTFTFKASQDTGEYCFQSSPISGWSAPITTSVNDCPNSLHGIFRRYAIFQPYTVSPTNPYIDRVKITIEVQWEELGKTYTVPITSVLSVWEKIYDL